MPLVLTLVNPSPIPVEDDSITLPAIRERAADDVLRILVQHGNRQVPLGDFFRATGSAADDATLVWQGDCAKIKLIGSGLAAGRILVEGNAGMHVGADMTGGEIEVRGNAADWVGAEMKGGRIRIRGDAGHCVGAGYRGARRGMTGGEILIDGNAGNEIGNTIRRGLIAIKGEAGDAVGFNMLAGTIFIFGDAGIRHGAGMRRGTIGLFGENPPPVLPTFKRAGTYRPQFLAVYFQHLQRMGFAIPEHLLNSPVHRYSGDLLELGKGEILHACPN
jgi:formylmethanofuran dehydrogenase subunit C